MNLAILVSGNGSNLQAIIEAIEKKELHNTKIELVISDRECFALDRANKYGIKIITIDRKKEISKQLEEIIPKNIDIIVLAGFLSIIPKEFCEQWNDKIINLHPSLLPKFGGKGMYGKYVHQAVIASKEKESGATVHFVTHEIDKGEIILQKKLKVLAEDTPESLAKRVQMLEPSLLIESLKILQKQIL